LIAEKPLTHLLMHQEAELDFMLNRFHILSLKENATNQFKKWLIKNWQAQKQNIKNCRKEIEDSYHNLLLS
jgi:hypothetical protein